VTDVDIGQERGERVPGIGVKIQNNLGIDVCLELAQYAERRGLDSVWVSEYRARDGITSMALIGGATERVAIGSSIIPIYTRSPAVLGMSLAALSEATGGRAILGLGTSSDVIVKRWNGRERTRPLSAMRDYVEIIRQVVAGKPTDYDGPVTASSGFSLELDLLAAPDARIYLAALGQKMLALGAEIGDGVVLNHPSVHYVSSVRQLLDEAAVRHGRAPDAVRFVTELRVGVGAPSELARMRAEQRKQLASYGRVPPYNNFYAESGFSAEAAALREAWGRKDNDAATAAVHDDMLGAIVAIGSDDAVQQRFIDLFKAGLDEIIVFPLWADEQEAKASRRIIDLAAEAAAGIEGAVSTRGEVVT
jgi:probable F420-dependent oxidoreductase